jgi:hypothetical protein
MFQIISTDVIESRARALEMADHYLRQGLPTWTFEDHKGRAYVTANRASAKFLIEDGNNRFLGYCHPRMYQVAEGIWSAECGRA